MTNTISIVTLTWNKKPKRLRDLLWALTHQTVMPDEIVVVDGNTDVKKQTETIAAALPFMRYRGTSVKILLAEMEKFNLSRGFNIGIKRSASDYVLTTGIDMVFGPNVIETVLSKMDNYAYCVAQCAFLIEGVKVPDDVYSAWKHLRERIKPKPPVKVSTGAMICASRGWWFNHQGYDEINHAFAFADSDVSMRMGLSGLQERIVCWEEAELIHVWHESSQTMVGKIGGEWPNAKWPLIRNPDGWGKCDPLIITGETE